MPLSPKHHMQLPRRLRLLSSYSCTHSGHILMSKKCQPWCQSRRAWLCASPWSASFTSVSVESEAFPTERLFFGILLQTVLAILCVGFRHLRISAVAAYVGNSPQCSFPCAVCGNILAICLDVQWMIPYYFIKWWGLTWRKLEFLMVFLASYCIHISS